MCFYNSEFGKQGRMKIINRVCEYEINDDPFLQLRNRNSDAGDYIFYAKNSIIDHEYLLANVDTAYVFACRSLVHNT
ncbi:Protocadherin gamma-B6 [Dirofilaria immitis]